ncbi:type II toxin-antitoxin system VapB family antitoxin [Nonomuraea sp. K274]|uniref:Type II toxin-antitoxin system VapB family antitoxin n=1 Tax=Nonomuraea cypriaca TaxID=1187855 RepID=A0A931A7F4_9ACTN|nr:type II toxin-antitoxin system VapB family antitoxin [Nonomuraea cypriaca]MBF8187651.1 type II toxin-antitoxin system VapB family antitoxin [Nonomuraea cypriaca]
MRLVVDIDKGLLEAAQQRLGAPTIEETVRAALQAVVDRDEERASAIEAFEFWRTRDNTDLLDPEITKDAW